jgi:hypothetical protein
MGRLGRMRRLGRNERAERNEGAGSSDFFKKKFFKFFYQ